ncbi:MAG TPA: hypothetical protein VH083_21510 [Myxococcales bacterium]|jgi:hypothetical protein|nr:hypothetical protein [Myxococcales bacterium]
MRLRGDVVEWLRVNVAASVEFADLDETYTFEHACNEARDLVSQQLKNAYFQWLVQFADRSSNWSLSQPLSRSVHPACPLWGSGGSGTVVYNHAFYPIPACQKCGFATALYANEARLYARWGVREIQMIANDSGPVVWVKRFGFLPKDPFALQEAYSTWARKWRQTVDSEDMSPPSLTPPAFVMDYPEAFLKTMRGLFLYKVVS